MTDRLSRYPFVAVRLSCDLCHRSGIYRPARLAEKYGAEISLEMLIDRLAFDCPWRRDPGDYRARTKRECGACLPDIAGAPRPPDLPPGMIRLRIVGGRDRGG